MSVDLGHVQMLGAEAVGQPGQRRFRLFLRNVSSSAVMWMEKEQLNSLSLAIDRFLAHISEGQVLRTEAQIGSRPTPERMPADFPRKPTYDFQVGQMKLHYDEDSHAFLLSTTPLEVVMERGQVSEVFINEEATVSFLFTDEQAQSLSRAIPLIVSAGRRVCPLCATPLDGSLHACVQQNGHRKIVQIQEIDEEG